jgi:RWD domain
VLTKVLRSTLTAAMQLSEDLAIEIEALQAIYDSAVTVIADTAMDHRCQGSSSARGSPGSQVELQLQLAPQTGGDESSVYVLTTLGISVPSGYPQQPPLFSLTTAKGEDSTKLDMHWSARSDSSTAGLCVGSSPAS